MTREGALRLRDCAEGMRQLRSESCRVASCTGKALEESLGVTQVLLSSKWLRYGSWAASIMSGVGLEERGQLVRAAGLSCGLTAEHLEEMAQNDEQLG